MQTKQVIISIILFVSLLYLTLIIPIFITTFSQKYYDNSYEYNQAKDYILKEDFDFAILNLKSYFLYQDALDDKIWTDKEEIHYKEVRHLLTIAFITGIVSIAIIILLFSKYKNLISKYAIANIVLLSILTLIILTNFEYFWDNIFHPILFNNNYWLMLPDEISYYIFYPPFFTNTIQFIVLTSIIENIILYCALKTQKLIKTNKQVFNK